MYRSKDQSTEPGIGLLASAARPEAIAATGAEDGSRLFGDRD